MSKPSHPFPPLTIRLPLGLCLALTLGACGDDGDGDAVRRLCTDYAAELQTLQCDVITQNCEDDCDPEEDCNRQLAGTGCVTETRAWLDCVEEGQQQCEHTTDEALDSGVTVCMDARQAVRACLGL